MRLLLVLNDASDGHHDDIHRSLTELRGESALEDFIVYPYIAKLNGGLKPSEVVSEVEDLANSFAPDAILWAHPSSLPVDERVVSRLRGLRSRPVLGCLEGDLYDRLHKPLPKNLRRLARACDVVFVIGYGRFVNRLVKNGFPAVLYVPLWADDSRFDLGMSDPGAATYDAVLVGNYWPSKIPFKTMPGAVQRARVVSLMEREFGDRFAVFGQGWAGPCARGPIPFDQQTLAYHMGRVAVGWDNLIVPLSFSDRLPIAMAKRRASDLQRDRGGAGGTRR